MLGQDGNFGNHDKATQGSDDIYIYIYICIHICMYKSKTGESEWES